jgi:hypothetical protein
MTNEEKSFIYDECLRESDYLQRRNSKLKSEYVTNIPPEIQNEINRNMARIDFLVKRLESLFN